ncbi:MAG: DUF1616 domain-containing protein [Candidatus Thorarchaeota archaeon]
MSNQSHDDKRDDNNQSKKQFDILLKVCLIIGIIIISGFIIYYALTPESGYITLGILNEEQKAEDYPTEAVVNESIFFYVTVENQKEHEFSFRIEILKGNNDTIVNSSGSFNALSYYNSSEITLLQNQFWMSNMLNISYSEIGTNQRLIIELWEIKDESEIFYTNLFLWLNITS